MPTFIGLDLAWGGRNPHGFCVLEGSGQDVRCTHIGSQAASVQALTESVARVKARTDSVIVAMDAPILFPTDPSLERPIDEVVTSVGFACQSGGSFEGWEASIVGGSPGTRFPRSTSLLDGNPHPHIAFEVYPNTIHIRLFNIAARLAYKWGSTDQRQQELLKYQKHLSRVLNQESPGILRNPQVRAVLSEGAVRSATSENAIKHLDDTLDGLTCALAAFLAWSKPGEWEMLGDMTGYMVQPARDANRAMPPFIGLDLAWTAHRESASAGLERCCRKSCAAPASKAAVCDTERLAGELAAVEGPVVVTIDAPLLYTPERWAEREVARRFGRYKASPHQAHYAVRQGYTAGIDLGQALAARGFTLDPAPLLRDDHDGRTAVEVFPHTVHVRLFGLSERLPYKPRGGRSVAFRRTVMQRYQATCAGAGTGSPSSSTTPMSGRPRPRDRGRGAKAYP